jgi:hypothetical protein
MPAPDGAKRFVTPREYAVFSIDLRKRPEDEARRRVLFSYVVYWDRTFSEKLKRSCREAGIACELVDERDRECAEGEQLAQVWLPMQPVDDEVTLKP